jgi:uncharacterized protein (TIGR02598 family)
MSPRRSLGFSLIEVTLALGIASFCLLAVFALLPIGAQIHRAAIGETEAAGILAAVISDLRATPRAATASTQFAVTFGNAKTLYFDGDGRPISSNANAKYRVTISFPANLNTTATVATLQVTWPAAADPATNAPGRLETVAAFDRQ